MRLLTTVLAGACAIGVMAAAGTAKADRDGWHHGGWHEWHHDHDWRGGYPYYPPRPYYYGPPAYSYVPPPVFYGPPAGGVYYGPPAGGVYYGP